MVRLMWHEPGSRRYEAGVDRGVLYPEVGPGLAWNGLISVSEQTTEADSRRLYLDGVGHAQRRRPGSFQAKVTAYSYPAILDELQGLSFTNSKPKPFGLSYRVQSDRGYLIHVVYNAMVVGSGSEYTTIGNGADPSNFSWDIFTRPNPLGSIASTAHMVIDTGIAHQSAVDAIEEILYGGNFSEPRLPSLDETLEIFESNSIVRITDHGDGTWSAEGPDSVIRMLDETTFEIDWPSAVYISEDTYRIKSL